MDGGFRSVVRIAALSALIGSAAFLLSGCFGGGGGLFPPGGGGGGGGNVSPTAAAFGQRVDGAYVYEFDGGGSSDPDGTIIAYQWSFGDGDTAVGSLVEHRYAALGEYVVRLTVVDDDGAMSFTELLVVIEGCSPEASFIATPSMINVTKVADKGPGDKISVRVAFDARKSYDCDGIDDIVWGVWDFGDGTTPIEGIWTRSSDDGDGVSQRFSVMREVSHVYKRVPTPEYTPGQTEPQTLHYTVTLTITDSQGHTSTTTKDVVFYTDTPLT